jgi:hypothetical protein
MLILGIESYAKRANELLFDIKKELMELNSAQARLQNILKPERFDYFKYGTSDEE